MPEVVLRLAVIGDPVEHSRSPEIQQRLFAEAGIAGTYERIRVAAGDGARSIAALRARGYHGLNVTTPLKEEAFACSQSQDALATATGSVNTLVFGETIGGYNTDGAGTLGVLADAGIHDLASARVLVLGAGPTARSAVAALRLARASVAVWNRTPERAAEFAFAFGARVFAAGQTFDAIFSAMPPNAVPHDDALAPALHGTPVFVDANYGARATLAAHLGRGGFDGTRMLEHSARGAFDLWHAHFFVRANAP